MRSGGRGLPGPFSLPPLCTPVRYTSPAPATEKQRLPEAHVHGVILSPCDQQRPPPFSGNGTGPNAPGDPMRGALQGQAGPRADAERIKLRLWPASRRDRLCALCTSSSHRWRSTLNQPGDTTPSGVRRGSSNKSLLGPGEDQDKCHSRGPRLLCAHTKEEALRPPDKPQLHHQQRESYRNHLPHYSAGAQEGLCFEGKRQVMTAGGIIIIISFVFIHQLAYY